MIPTCQAADLCRDRGNAADGDFLAACRRHSLTSSRSRS